jgi:hypothetical protein
MGGSPLLEREIMKQAILLTAICLVLSGCNSDREVTVTPELDKLLTRKVFIEDINSQNEAATAVLRESIYQGLLANGIQISNNRYNATIIAHVNGVMGYRAGTELAGLSVDSITVRATNTNGELLLLGSFSIEPDRICTIQAAGKWVGEILAKKLRR